MNNAPPNLSLLYIDGVPCHNFGDFWQRFHVIALHPDSTCTAFSESTPVGFLDLKRLARHYGYVHTECHQEGYIDWTTQEVPHDQDQRPDRDVTMATQHGNAVE